MWLNFTSWLDRNFLIILAIFAFLCVIWAAIRPNPGTPKIW